VKERGKNESGLQKVKKEKGRGLTEGDRGECSFHGGNYG